MGSNLFFSLTSEDIDEIPAALPDWTVEWRQLSKGHFRSQLKYAQLDGIELFYLSWNQAVHIQGGSPPGTVSFGIEISSQGRSLWQGLEYDSRDVLINSDRVIDLKLPAGYELFAVSIQRDLLLECADLQQRHLHEKDLQKKMGRVNLAALNAIKAYLHSSFGLLELNLADTNQYPDTQSIIQDVMSLLITVLLSAEDYSAQSPTQLSHSQRRMQLIKQVERYMLTHIDQPLTIDQLCAIVEISERSLNNYFRDLFDMSPMAYFKTLRLNRARSALKVANPAIDTVASIAKRWGFQHMGYFSVDYKSMFGESPSKTLRRSI